MVEGLLAPINLIIAALGVGFLLPLIARSSEGAARALFWLTQFCLLLLSGVWSLRLINGAPPVEIITAGIQPPFAINLRFGLFEAFVVFAVNLSAILGSGYLLTYFRAKASAMSIYLILVMGISGMVMTRDLFNLFIFIEITALATYGMLALDQRPASLAAGFKYVIATSLASTFFLIGTMLLYHLIGATAQRFSDCWLAGPGVGAGTGARLYRHHSLCTRRYAGPREGDPHTCSLCHLCLSGRCGTSRAALVFRIDPAAWRLGNRLRRFAPYGCPQRLLFSTRHVAILPRHFVGG